MRSRCADAGGILCDRVSQAAKAISSPVPVEWYPTLAVVMVSVGLMLTASFFMLVASHDICNCTAPVYLAIWRIGCVKP